MRANTARRTPNMPQHPHNDRTQQRLLPWIALIGFLGVALYALLPADFWLPEYKSAHHTVTPPQAITADDFEDNDWEDEIAQQPPKLPPVTAPPKEIPGPPLSAKPSAQTADGGQFKKHYQTYRLPGDYWHNLQKSGLNPTLLAQLEPLQTRLENPALTHLELLYSDYYKDGKTDPKNSKIIAVRLNTARGSDSWYARHEHQNTWYYDADGNAPEAAMDRIPLASYDHISSPFDPVRLHPITRIIRPHEGTDFKAAYGAPVRATGDGVVRFAGWQGGYGRVIIIDHVNGYQTRYAHLSDINVETGAAVKRGQTIGNLGNSGRSTGSHLHYEVRIDDIPHDPMTVDLPSARPLAANYKDAWQYRCGQYEKEMNALAKNKTPR